MKKNLPKIFLVVILSLILVNLGYLDYKLFRVAPSPTPEGETLVEQVEPEGCSPDCQELIDQKISETLLNIPTQKPEKTVTYVLPTTSPGAQTKVSYIPLMSEATVNYPDWTDVTPSDFYFDLDDYSGAKSVRFEVYLKSKHQAGKTYIRLYDVTNKRAVDYSDLSSSSETFELQRSSDLVIWRGNNLYRIQGKTLNGIEGYFKEVKLKISF